MLAATHDDGVQHQGHEYVRAADVPALVSAVLLVGVLCSRRVFPSEEVALGGHRA